MLLALKLTKFKENRVVFHFLPSICQNDLVEGSWWFVWGSLLATIIAAVPLADIYLHFFNTPEESRLDAFKYSATWILLLCIGAFFTAGALAFVRAFKDPPVPPLLCISDEILGAWLTLIGCLPTIAYTLVYIASDHNNKIYWGGLGGAIAINIGATLFLYSCYLDSLSKPILYTFLAKILGEKSRVLKHVSSDFLVACWLFFYGSLVCILGCCAFVYYSDNQRQYFIYCTSLGDSILFAIGSAYFVAGSYKLEEPLKSDSINSPVLRI